MQLAWYPTRPIMKSNNIRNANRATVISIPLLCLSKWESAIVVFPKVIPISRIIRQMRRITKLMIAIFSRQQHTSARNPLRGQNIITRANMAYYIIESYTEKLVPYFDLNVSRPTARPKKTQYIPPTMAVHSRMRMAAFDGRQRCFGGGHEMAALCCG